jgi:phage shock protein PspC (stress-responsive transcriptional regulator)
MPHDFPYGVVIILSCGLAFTGYIIYYIMKLAFEEMKDEKEEK